MTAFRLPQLGELVADKYRVLRVVADGGMGIVFEAHHELLGKSVALKFPLPELAHVPSIVERFLAEARLCARIENEHVVRVLDVSKLDGLPYIVMELVSGVSLTAQLGAPWAPGKAASFAIQILEGLEAVHVLGVVHRDVKPDNVLVTESARGPILKLIDFGIAKDSLAQEAMKRLTHAGAMLGTPAYMAPEQIRDSAHASARADLYSAGVVLFEMLGGASPFTSTTTEGLMMQAFTGEMRALRELAPNVPPELTAVLARGTALDPAQRFATAREFMDALLPFAEPAFLGVGQTQTFSRRSQSDAPQPNRTVPIAAVGETHPTPPPATVYGPPTGPMQMPTGAMQMPFGTQPIHATPAPSYATPPPNYATPAPAASGGYATPPPTQYGAPATQYAEPPQATQYGAPPTQYGAPPQYGTPPVAAAYVPPPAYAPPVAAISAEKSGSARAIAVGALGLIALAAVAAIVVAVRHHSNSDASSAALIASAPPETDIAPLASEAPDPSASAAPRARAVPTTPPPPAAPKSESAEAISEAVSNNGGRFRRCETEPQASEVTVELHVADDGSVRSASPVNTTATPAQTECVVNAAQSMRFPPHEGADEVARAQIPLAAAQAEPEPNPERRQHRFQFPGRQRRGRQNEE